MARLYSPVGGGLGRWQDDPLGLWPAWWQARAGQGMQLRDGFVAVREEREAQIVRMVVPVRAREVEMNL